MDADANANANANTDAGGSTIALREFCSGELMSKLILKESYLNDKQNLSCLTCDPS